MTTRAKTWATFFVWAVPLFVVDWLVIGPGGALAVGVFAAVFWWVGWRIYDRHLHHL